MLSRVRANQDQLRIVAAAQQLLVILAAWLADVAGTSMQNR